jgi:hypothetical protein
MQALRTASQHERRDPRRHSLDGTHPERNRADDRRHGQGRPPILTRSAVPIAAAAAGSCRATPRRRAAAARTPNPSRYLTSVSILNIGRYIEMMMMPTMTPTPIIMIGSTIEVSDDTADSTSSS